LLSWSEVKQHLESIKTAFHNKDHQQVREILMGIEQLGYHPSDDISDWYYQPEKTNEAFKEKRQHNELTVQNAPA